MRWWLSFWRGVVPTGVVAAVTVAALEAVGDLGDLMATRGGRHLPIHGGGGYQGWHCAGGVDGPGG